VSERTYTGNFVRVMTTGDGKGHIFSAMLQQRTGVDAETGRETWEDVRPLTISMVDNTVTIVLTLNDEEGKP